MNRNVCRFVEFNQFLFYVVPDDSFIGRSAFPVYLSYCVSTILFRFLFLFGPYHSLRRRRRPPPALWFYLDLSLTRSVAHSQFFLRFFFFFSCLASLVHLDLIRILMLVIHACVHSSGHRKCVFFIQYR